MSKLRSPRTSIRKTIDGDEQRSQRREKSALRTLHAGRGLVELRRNPVVNWSVPEEGAAAGDETHATDADGDVIGVETVGSDTTLMASSSSSSSSSSSGGGSRKQNQHAVVSDAELMQSMHSDFVVLMTASATPFMRGQAARRIRRKVTNHRSYTTKDIRSEIGKIPQLIPILVAAVGSESIELQSHAIWLIYELAQADEECARAFVHFHAVAVFLHIAETSASSAPILHDQALSTLVQILDWPHANLFDVLRRDRVLERIARMHGPPEGSHEGSREEEDEAEEKVSSATAATASSSSMADDPTVSRSRNHQAHTAEARFLSQFAAWAIYRLAERIDSENAALLDVTWTPMMAYLQHLPLDQNDALFSVLLYLHHLLVIHDKVEASTLMSGMMETPGLSQTVLGLAKHVHIDVSSYGIMCVGLMLHLADEIQVQKMINQGVLQLVYALLQETKPSPVTHQAGTLSESASVALQKKKNKRLSTFQALNGITCSSPEQVVQLIRTDLVPQMIAVLAGTEPYAARAAVILLLYDIARWGIDTFVEYLVQQDAIRYFCMMLQSPDAHIQCACVRALRAIFDTKEADANPYVAQAQAFKVQEYLEAISSERIHHATEKADALETEVDELLKTYFGRDNYLHDDDHDIDLALCPNHPLLPSAVSTSSLHVHTFSGAAGSGPVAAHTQPASQAEFNTFSFSAHNPRVTSSPLEFGVPASAHQQNQTTQRGSADPHAMD
jgi:hypothetical protein